MSRVTVVWALYESPVIRPQDGFETSSQKGKLRGMYRVGSPSARFRWILGIYAIVFLGGGLRHGYEILNAGLLPPSTFPRALHLYWDALFLLDLVTVALIPRHWRAAVLLAMVIMATDVIANVYAEYLLHAPSLLNLFGNLPFILFAVFVYVTAPLLLEWDLGLQVRH